MKNCCCSFSIIALLCFTYACKVPKTVGTPTNKLGQWQALFNGKNLIGWETMGQLETTVKEGALHIHATHPNNNAWVYTKAAYQNFELETEFLMADSATNSGLLFRFDPTKEGLPNTTAYEANIDWRINHQNIMGTLENAARANNIPTVNIAHWHSLKIIANGENLKVYFNDKMICETNNRRSTEGRIALQVPINKGGDIAFRNILLKELPATLILPPSLEDTYRNSKLPLKSLFDNQALTGWHTIGAGEWTFYYGELHGYSGEQPSYLVSDKTYKDFYLKCQFKIKKEDNSGIFIRKHPDSTQISLTDAIECNIYDHNGPSHAYSTGSIVTFARAWYKMIDYTAWNEMEIFAKDEHIILYINGQKSTEAYLPDAFNKAGNICLQAGTRIFSDNGPSDIYFKNMQIREMDQK